MHCLIVFLGGGKKFSATFQFFSFLSQPCKILIQVFIVLKIDIFLIHSGSVQKMLTALYKLIWSIQKTTWTNFFEHQGKMFLNIEKDLVKIMEKQPYMHYLLVILHIFGKRCQIFIDL